MLMVFHTLHIQVSVVEQDLLD